MTLNHPIRIPSYCLLPRVFWVSPCSLGPWEAGAATELGVGEVYWAVMFVKVTKNSDMSILGAGKQGC